MASRILKPGATATTFVLLMLFSVSTRATTWHEVTVVCPICQTRTSERVPGSTFIPATSPDFRPQGVGVDMTASSLVMCPTCGFTATYGQFDQIESLDKDKVRAALAALRSPRLFQKLDRAITVEKNWANDPCLIARLTLAAKWRADDTGETTIIKKRLGDAIHSHTAALDSATIEDGEKGPVTYLIGELYRQAGDPEQAVTWFSKAEKLVDKEMTYLVQQQTFLARYSQEKPTELMPLLAASRDGEKVAAIRFLRDSQDPTVITFLKNLCLNGPEDLREPSIEALLGDEPKAHHLPIFLEGLRNKHFRTVQGCAWGVEALKASEAAPVIVEVLKNPVEATEYRLLAALAAVATERQLDYLAGQLDRDTHFDEVFEALLNTRSPKAVPYVLQMLQKERMLGSFCDEASLENAAAMGPVLLQKLPDLAGASADDGAAVFKVSVLGVAKSDSAEDQLIAAMKRGGDVGMYAALALAGKGNDAAKPVLLEQLDHVRSRDSTSITLLYPLLKPSDYDKLYQMMLDSKAKEKASIEERAADCRKTLADAGAEADEKEWAQEELKRLKWNEDWFMTRWLPLLGATGSAKGRPVYLECLESDSPQLRAESAKALAGVYDDDVGDTLASRLGEEDTWVAEAIIEAIGKAGDTRQVQSLLAFVGEPTLVSTKIVWIDTMMRLAPDKALPVIRHWSESPNPDLAQACKRAISAQGQ